MVARHAVTLGAGDRRQLHGQPVQHRQHLGQRGQLIRRGAVQRREILAHAAHDVPLLVRQALAQRLRTGRQRPQVEGDAARRRIGQRAEQRALEQVRRLVQRRRTQGRQAAVHRHRRQGCAHAFRRIVVGVDEHEHGARQAHHLLGALGVASEPEQVFGCAAGHWRAPRCDIVDADRLRQHRKAVHRPVGHHPGVQAGPAALHRHAGGVELGHARHAAGQHMPMAVALGDRIDAHHRRARQQRAIAPHRCTRTAHRFGHGPGVGIVLNAHRSGLAHGRRPPATGEGAAQQLACQLRRNVAPGHRLAAPPGTAVTQAQFLPEQAARNGRQETMHRRRFEEGAAQRVGHHHIAGAQRLHQARHAQCGVGTQLQWVAPAIVQTAQYAVHRLQALHRLHEQSLLAHHQVAAFHQWQPQVARQVGMLEIGFAIGPGRQQHDTRRGAAGDPTRRRLDRIQQPPVAQRDVLHAQFAESVRKLARDDEPVVQHITQPGRALSALRHHPPGAVRRARQVEGDDVQAQPAGRHHAAHRRR